MNEDRAKPYDADDAFDPIVESLLKYPLDSPEFTEAAQVAAHNVSCTIAREVARRCVAASCFGRAFICHREGGSVLTAVVQQLVVYWIHVGGP